jgi:hypothetical protein
MKRLSHIRYLSQGGALPFLGILLDYIGMAWFYFILALTLSIFVTTLFIQNLVAQYCCLFFGVLYQACWGTYAQRWAVYFAPFVFSTRLALLVNS